MPSVATVRQENLAQKVRSTLESIPCIGIVLGAVFGFFENQIKSVNKRKSTYKLALYFRYQMWMAVFGSAIFLYLSLAMLAGLGGLLKPEATCETRTKAYLDSIDESKALYDANGIPDAEIFMKYAEQERQAIECKGDPVQNHIRSICSKTQATTLAALMLSIGILYLVVTAACLFLSLGYSFFSNLPGGSITTDASDCRITCLGAIAKQGPKLLRLANVGAFVCLLVVVIMVEGSQICKGDVSMTHKCLSFHDDCAFNQIKNCIFYFSENCRKIEETIPSPSLTYKEAYTKCLDPTYFSRFSGRFDVRVVHKTDCVRCWMLHFDCLDTAIDLIRTVQNTDLNSFSADSSKFTVAPYYGDVAGTSSDRQNLLKLIKCKCGTSESSSGNLISGATGDCSSLPAVATATCDLSGQPSVLTRVADLTFDQDKDDEPYVSERSDRTFMLATKQFCSWVPSQYQAYFFEESECSQSGSYIARISSLGAIVMLFLASLVILVGGLLRVNVQQETWCYNPPKPSENSCWKLVRLTGPG